MMRELNLTCGTRTVTTTRWPGPPPEDAIAPCTSKLDLEGACSSTMPTIPRWWVRPARKKVSNVLRNVARVDAHPVNCDLEAQRPFAWCPGLNDRAPAGHGAIGALLGTVSPVAEV